MKIDLNSPLSDFVQVKCTFESSQNIYTMHKEHLERFVKATLELHFSPGINPSTKGETAKIRQIHAGPFRLCKPYWWTTPGLGDNDAEGAVIVDSYCLNRVWVHPEILALEALYDED